MNRFGLIIASILLTGASLLMAASAPQRSPQRMFFHGVEEALLPLRIQNGRPYVQASIDGSTPLWFLVDTGTSTTILKRETALLLQTPIRSAPSTSLGFGGSVPNHEVGWIGSLKLGNAEFQGFEADVQPAEGSVLQSLNGERVAGVLGFPVFQDCLLTLDYPRHQLRITRGSLPRPNGRDVLPFLAHLSGQPKSLNKLPIVQFEVNGQYFNVLFDSGLDQLLAIPEPLLTYLAPEQPIVRIPRLLLYGTGGQGQSTRYVRVPFGLKIGKFTLNRPIGLVAKPWGALRMGFALLGGEFMKNFVLTFDQQKKAVRLETVYSPELDYRQKSLRVRYLKLDFYDEFWIVPANITVAGKTLEAGDAILFVNRQPVQNLTPKDWEHWIQSSNSVFLTILRNKKIFEVDFPLVFLPPANF